MKKNFLDTQTGGTSEVSSSIEDKSQKTDLSPKQVEDIKKSSEKTKSVPQDLNIDLEKEQDAEERVDAVMQGTTKDNNVGITAEDSTPNKILSEYDSKQTEETEQEEKDALGVIYDKANKESQLNEEDLVDRADLNASAPLSSVTDIRTEKQSGALIPTKLNSDISYDPEIDKEFKEMPNGNISNNEYLLNRDLNTNENFFKSEDQQFFTFEGVPISKNKVLPETEKKRLKGEPEDAEPGYYTFKGKRYLKTADGEWQQIKYREYYSRAKRAFVQKEVLMRLNKKHSRLLEENGYFQFNEENASKQLLDDFMFGRENVNIDYSKNKYAPGEEISIQDEQEEVAVKGYRNFQYPGEKVSELDERVKGRKEPYKAKRDGEYQWNGKKYAKKDGKWYSVVEGKDDPVGLFSRVLDRLDIGSDLELKEIKYSNVVDIELESVFTKKSKEYLEKTVYDLAQSFDHKVQNLLKMGANYIVNSNVDDLVKDKEFTTEPIFDFVDKFANEMGIDLEEKGFTTPEIERAEAQIYQLYGGVLNDSVEKERVKFELSTDFMFRPNPYDLEAARQRVNKTFFEEFNFAPKSVKRGFNPDLVFPLTDYEVAKYKGMGYLSENNTFSLPKMPGIYFLGNDYARKIDNGNGEYSWVDSNGVAITDPKKKGLYESSSYDESISNTALGYISPIEAMSFNDNDKMQMDPEGTNVKDSKVYNMIFSDNSMSKFFSESSSSLSSDPYFIALKNAYQSDKDFYSYEDFMKSLSGVKTLSDKNINDIDDQFISFSHKLEKEIQDYNDYVSAESSLKYFVLNIDKFKDNAYPGVDKEDFDNSLDLYGMKAIEILTNGKITNANKVDKIESLQHEISVWKENLEKTNNKLQEIRNSGTNVANYMFSNKLKTMQTLGNIGNSKQLNEAMQLWNINKELIDIMEYSRNISRSASSGDVSMGFDYIDSSLGEKIKALQDQSDQFLRQKSVDYVNEKSEITAKIDNINRAIPFLESIYYGDYKSEEAIMDSYREAGGSYADIPEDLELTPNQKADLKLRIEILERTKAKLVSELEENESSSLGFFRVDPQAVTASLAESEESVRPYVAALPSGKGFSSKDKFDMMFEQMNNRRLELEQKLNLSGKTMSSALEIRLDKLKDLFFTDMSPAEKEYYQLVYNTRLLAPIYLNNTQATEAEINGFFNSLMGGIFEFAFPNTAKASGALMMGKGMVGNISSSPKQQILDIAGAIDRMQNSEKVEGMMELTSDASDEFSGATGWAMQEDTLGDRDFWGNTLGVTLGIITLFRKANQWTKLGYKGILGTEKLIRRSPKKFESIIAKSIGKYQKQYNQVMSRNKLTKYLVGPSLAYGTQFEITGRIFNDEKVGKELTFAAGAAGGLLSQGFVKGFPFLSRNIAGMTKAEYQQFMRGVFGSKTSSTMQRLNTLSKAAGWGTAETMQETGEELVHAWEDSENGKNFLKVLEERFGTFDKLTRFAVSTFVMGMAFGIGSKGGLADAISDLNEEQYAIYERVTNEIKANHDAARKEAEKARQQYTQSAVNAANAVDSQKLKQDDSKDQTRVPGEEQVGEESVEAKPVEETGKEEAGSDRVVQEEQEIDPYRQYNNQRKKRIDWNKEKKSKDVIDDLKKRSGDFYNNPEKNEFVDGTTEDQVAFYYSSILTENQRKQVENMSENGPVTTYQVYKEILSLTKQNFETNFAEPEAESQMDFSEDIKEIQDTENTLEEDNREAIRLREEMDGIEGGLDPGIESEMKQTLLAQNEGEMSFTDEYGNTVTKEGAETEADFVDLIKSFDSLSDVNKKVLRSMAKKQLREESLRKSEISDIKRERDYRRRKKIKFEEKGTFGPAKKKARAVRRFTDREIDQRARQIHRQKIESMMDVRLGPSGKRTIDSERATLTYNEEKSNENSSIVYDINDETGRIGQVSGNYTSDYSDFVITDITSDRVDNFEQETIDALAENVNGDIIISGKTDIGKQMHKDDLVVMDENGDYVLPNQNTSTVVGRKARPGDGIRSFKILATQGGITLNSGPGANLYNAALEVAARIVDAGGSVAKAVSSARDAYRNSSYYKKLKAEEQARSIQQIDLAIRDALTTEQFIELETVTGKSVEAALKEFQKTEVYKNANRKQKAKLTREFKADLQEKVDKRVAMQADEKSRAEGYKMLEEAKKIKSKFEHKIDIKNKILELQKRTADTKEGMKIMQKLKSQVTSYIKSNLPVGTRYTASEVKSLVDAVQKAKDGSTIEKAFEKVDELIDKKAGQKLTEERKKAKRRITPTNLRKELTRKKGGRRKGKVTAYSVDALTSYISQIGGMDAISQMNLEEVQEFNDVLDGIIGEGKTDFKAAQRLLHSAKRKAQGSIILGFDSLALERRNRNVKSIADIREHLNTPGNFVIIGGKYYTKTDFKENQAEAIKEFRDTDEYKNADADQKKVLLENFKNTSASVSFEEFEGDIDFNSDDFGAFYSMTPSQKSKIRGKGRAGRANPFPAAMDVYGLLIKAYSGPLIGSRKGNNNFKDFINKNIAEKMPTAFARTQQQTYELSQEHKKKLEEIFGKGTFNKALRQGEEAFRIMLLGGFASVPSVLREQANLGLDVMGERENRIPTNDQVVHIYNMARNPNDKLRLERQGINVDAIIDYVINSEGSRTEEYIDEDTGNVVSVTEGGNLQRYADYLMDFYNNRARDLYEDSYEKYTEGMRFDGTTAEENKTPYYPTTGELTNDEAKAEQSLMDLIGSGANSSQISMALNPGSFQQKTGKGNINTEKGATEVFADYNRQNTRYKNFADIINSVATIYGNQNVTDMMEENMGTNAFNKLKQALSDSISGEAAMIGQIPLAMSFINSMGVVGTLAFKPQQIAKQATSFMHFWNAGIKYGLKGENPGVLMGMVPTKNPFAATFGLVNKETRDFESALLKSAFVVERWRGGGSSLDLDLRRARMESQKNGTSIIDQLLRMPTQAVSSVSNPLLITTRMGDMAGVLFGPGGGMTFAVNMYKKFKSEGMSHEEAKTRAIEIFQAEATQSQQTTQVDNLSAAQKNALFRMAGMYRTSQAAAAKKTMRAVNAMFDKTKKTKKEKAQIAADFIYFGMFSPMLFTAVTTGFVMSALSLTGAASMAVDDRDDEDKVFARHAYDWLADNAQSLLQGYAYGGFVADGFLNFMRDRAYFNTVPMLKILDNLYEGGSKMIEGGTDVVGGFAEDSVLGGFGLFKNTEQLVELYDLMTADEKDWRKILNKAMNWQDRYLQPAYDYGKDDLLFEQVSKMWVEGGEEYMREVTPVKDVFKRHTYEDTPKKKKGYSKKTYRKN